MFTIRVLFCCPSRVQSFCASKLFGKWTWKPETKVYSICMKFRISTIAESRITANLLGEGTWECYTFVYISCMLGCVPRIAECAFASSLFSHRAWMPHFAVNRIACVFASLEVVKIFVHLVAFAIGHDCLSSRCTQLAWLVAVSGTVYILVHPVSLAIGHGYRNFPRNSFVSFSRDPALDSCCRPILVVRTASANQEVATPRLWMTD